MSSEQIILGPSLLSESREASFPTLSELTISEGPEALNSIVDSIALDEFSPNSFIEDSSAQFELLTLSETMEANRDGVISEDLQHFSSTSLDVQSDPFVPTTEWVGGNSNSWHDPLNWSTGELPDENDFVLLDVSEDEAIVVSQGTINIAEIFSNERLDLSGGTLDISGKGAFNSGLEISRGTLQADGQVTLGGTSSWTGWGWFTGTGEILNTGTLNILGDGFSAGTLNATLSNTGTIIQNTNGRQFSLSDGRINNLRGGTFNLESGSIRVSNGDKTGSFDNKGTLLKRTESQGRIDVALNNSNVIKVEEGTLTLRGGGFSTQGINNISEGAFLEFDGGTHTLEGTHSFSGKGSTRLVSGALAASDDAVINSNEGSFEIYRGTLQADGQVTLGGTSSWTGWGWFTGTGEILNTGTLNILNDGNSAGTLNATLSNTGTIIQNTNGRQFSLSDGRINNLKGGTFNLESGSIRVSNGEKNWEL